MADRDRNRQYNRGRYYGDSSTSDYERDDDYNFKRGPAQTLFAKGGEAIN
ncbi:MAG: hypothetical protein KJ077_41070 [Anaerolineae bacterium]|nr:hypothetical protein [Anaerolineae bacterium]